MTVSEYLAQCMAALARDGVVYLRVKVVPGAQHTALAEVLDTPEGPLLKVRIAAVAERGKANGELLALLERETGASCQLLRGHTSAYKLLQLRALLPENTA